MSILKNYWLRASAAVLTLMLGIGLLVNAKERVEAETKEVPASTTYFYNGPATNLASNVMDPGNWDPAQGEGFSCGAPTDIPCSLEVPANTDIEQHLDDLGDLAGVQAATNTRRN